ncbi:MAG: NAD-dependent epimerase/dehydratase family protein, partial [Armatimonadota bacterium]
MPSPAADSNGEPLPDSHHPQGGPMAGDARSTTVVIAGGSGLLGTALTRTLLASGVPVVWIARKPSPPKSLPALRVLAWDDEPAWRGAVADAAAVVNLCGASVAGQRWDSAYKDELVRSRLEPTAKLA